MRGGLDIVDVVWVKLEGEGLRIVGEGLTPAESSTFCYSSSQYSTVISSIVDLIVFYDTRKFGTFSPPL